MGEPDSVLDPGCEALGRVRVVLFSQAEAILVKSRASVVPALQEGGMQPGGRQNQFGHRPRVLGAQDKSHCPLGGGFPRPRGAVAGTTQGTGKQPDLPRSGRSHTRAPRHLPPARRQLVACRWANRSPTKTRSAALLPDADRPGRSAHPEERIGLGSMTSRARFWSAAECSTNARIQLADKTAARSVRTRGADQRGADGPSGWCLGLGSRYSPMQASTLLTVNFTWRATRTPQGPSPRAACHAAW